MLDRQPRPLLPRPRRDQGLRAARPPRSTRYPGNFKQYVRLREERYERQLKECEAQKEYIEKQEEYIRRVHYGQLHKQAAVAAEAARQARAASSGRRKVEAPHMHFGEVRRSGDVVFHAEDLDQALRRQAAVRGPELRPAARPAARHHGAERQRQDDAAAHPARRGGADRGRVQRGHLVELGYSTSTCKTADRGQAGHPGRLAGGRPGRRPSRRCATCSAASACAARSVEQRVGDCSRRRAEPGGAGQAGGRRASTCWSSTSRPTTSTSGPATRWRRR